MTQPISYHTPTAPLDFNNRKGMLLAFGIIMIILGALAGCMSALTPIGLYMSSRSVVVGPMPPSGVTSPTSRPVVATSAKTTSFSTTNFPRAAMIIAIGMYVAAAVGLIWTGIGCIRAQRWVRPIVMIFGTLWIVGGAIGLVNALFSAPLVRAAMAANPAPAAATTASFAWVVTLFSAVFILVFGVALPAVMVWMFSSIDVIRTLEFYDPKPRWTERCPLPVLGMSCTAALLALGSLMGLVYHAMPLFGVLISGPAAYAVWIVQSALFAAAAVLLYRLRPLGWWITLVMLVLINISTIITVTRFDQAALAEAMGSPPEQVQLMRTAGRSTQIGTMIMWPIVMLAALIYVLRMRRYFIGGDFDGSALSQQPG